MYWAVLEAMETVEVFQGEERAADDLLGGGDDPLKCFPFCRCAAGKPHKLPAD